MIADLYRRHVAALQGAFPTVTVADYPAVRLRVRVPAVLLMPPEITATDGDGTEQLLLDARFEAVVVLDQTTIDPHLTACELAAAVALNVHQGRRRGLAGAGEARVVRCSPDETRQDLFPHVVWSVEWTHSLALGESVWTGEGVPVTQIAIGDTVVYP